MKDSDFLHGAASIAGFYYGDPTKTRQIYHLSETGDLPIIKIGGRLTARKSALIRAIEEREREAAGRSISPENLATRRVPAVGRER